MTHIETIDDYVEESNVGPTLSEGNSAGSICRALPNFLAVTLTHPQTKPWMKKNSSMQKRYLMNLFNRMCMELNPMCHEKVTHLSFEFHENGQIHAHGYISFEGNYCVQGMISDFAKTYLNALKLVYKTEHYYPQFHRYREAAICVQYMDDYERQKQWIGYMGKAQFDN